MLIKYYLVSPQFLMDVINQYFARAILCFGVKAYKSFHSLFWHTLLLSHPLKFI